MIEIVPSILVKTKDEFEQMIRRLEPVTNRVHLDIIDGGFVPDKTILGYEELKTISTPLLFDVHLMVTQPGLYVPQWLDLNSDRIFIHAESEGDLGDLLAEIKAGGKKAGLVINPDTEVGFVLEYVPMIDYIQFMTVHPGSYGRTFLDEALNKIDSFHSDYPEIPIIADGGINPQTAGRAVAAGASILVSGSYIQNSSDPAKAISELKNGL
ncbi:ribulose-phosphate 3-epimerase [Candidatus Parcubacteria bacterium]|nr:ribulose-phosphate 3-epimerase [Candidatus Parcubacteria bacterium]